MEIVPHLDQSNRMEDEIGYHSNRALAELDRARESADIHVARCHLKLAEQHLERMRSLCRESAANASPLSPA